MTTRGDDRDANPSCLVLGLRAPRAALRFAGLAALAVLAFLWLGRELPRVPWASTDSDSYLQFSPVRPHGYSLMLSGYRLVCDDLLHLPSVQLALFVGAVLLLAVAVGRRTCSFAAAVATLVVTFAALETTSFPYVLTDPVYAAAVTACFCWRVQPAVLPSCSGRSVSRRCRDFFLRSCSTASAAAVASSAPRCSARYPLRCSASPRLPASSSIAGASP
jgi:hypothetical protein